MNVFQADVLYPVSADPIPHGVVVARDDGTIEAVLDPAIHEIPSHARQLNGALVPGFVNAHCHLELSYMHSRIPRHTGLNDFIRLVEQLKLTKPEEILASAYKADEQMFSNGIAAVGDIANGASAVEVKTKSRMAYHTFIEVFGFAPARAEKAFAHGLAMEQQLSNAGLTRFSLSPHAPYSVSDKLLEMIIAHTGSKDQTLTLHNQENADENQLFKSKSGPLVARLEHFGVDLTGWEAPGSTSLLATLRHLPASQKFMLVHNTVTAPEEVKYVSAQYPRAWWCFCPGANLYIENSLPAIDEFVRQEVQQICLGTDSLASNDTLSIWDEMMLVHRHFEIDFNEILKWATLNGARFLDMDDALGSIEPNKKPGLNLVQIPENNVSASTVDVGVTRIL